MTFVDDPEVIAVRNEVSSAAVYALELLLFPDDPCLLSMPEPDGVRVFHLELNTEMPEDTLSFRISQTVLPPVWTND
jgi:hypothetical protein